MLLYKGRVGPPHSFPAMMDNDTSWCPACDRQIPPKRTFVPIPQAPLPPQKQRGPRPRATAPVKHRLVIDQGPTPLYCSDECQMADLKRGLPHDYHPDRQSPPASAVSFSSHTLTDVASSCSSIESEQSVESPPTISPSLAKLAEIYNFPPFPPPAPVQDEPHPGPSYATDPYSSGIIMAARRIMTELAPPPPKKDSYGRIIYEPRKPIPGWTDGSNEWRSSIYSLSATKSQHKSFAARSSKHGSPRSSYVSPPPPSESDSEMLHKFSQSFTRCASRVSVPSSSPLTPSSSSTSPIPRRERPLLHRGAQGKLLVPDVMMRVPSRGSTTSLSSQSSTTYSRKDFQSPPPHVVFSEDEGRDSRQRHSSQSKRTGTESMSPILPRRNPFFNSCPTSSAILVLRQCQDVPHYAASSKNQDREAQRDSSSRRRTCRG